MQTADNFNVGDLVLTDGKVWRVMNKRVVIDMHELTSQACPGVAMRLEGAADDEQFSTTNMQRLVPEQS